MPPDHASAHSVVPARADGSGTPASGGSVQAPRLSAVALAAMLVGTAGLAGSLSQGLGGASAPAGSWVLGAVSLLVLAGAASRLTSSPRAPAEAAHLPPQASEARVEPSATTDTPDTPDTGSTAPFVPAPLATAEGTLRWQIDLLASLPGAGVLLQPGASDWIAIAVHRAPDSAELGPAPWADLPLGLSNERLQPLTHLLAAHPAWPALAIRQALDDTASRPAREQARRLPLTGGACIVWMPPRAEASEAAGAPASAAADGPTPMSLDEKESIAYSVSHDLRAPIRVIEGFARILREDYGAQLDRIGNDHLDRVLGAATRMNSMIDALLTLSRLSTRKLEREQVSLSRLAEQVALELQRLTPQRQVEVSIQPGLNALGDPTLLHSVLENLLGNAWKYSARRERAHISFSADWGTPPGANAEAPAQRIYRVRDDGAGFDMRFAERLFSPFQRLHSASEFAGNGVGLASVRRIVHRHGGQIWAEAEVDRGACFSFTLG